MSVFGVDFGCRNCVLAVTRTGGIDVICNEVSKRETSAYVSLGDEERYIGESGLDKAVRAATNTVTNIQRFIGMKADDPSLAREKEFVYAPTTADSNGRLQFELNYRGETVALYPEQILAMLLAKFKQYVSIETKTDLKQVRDCVISVPAWYTAEQRKLVMQAADIADLHCMSVVNETTAALVDYGIFRGLELPETEDAAQVVAVVDVGYAGTTVTIAKFWRGNTRVLATEYDSQFGTRDIDYEMLQHFAKEIQKKYKVDVLSSRRPTIRVLQAVEKVKNMLSANLVAPLNIECIMDVDVNFNTFNRDEMEAIIAPQIARFTSLCERAIAAAGVDVATFTAVEMIGGGCRVPAFKTALQNAFQHAPRFTLNASESIARGCAVTAAVFSPLFRVREFVVHEKPLLPVCIGIKAENPPTTSSVSFLPDVNKILTVLRANDAYPKTEEVVLTEQKTGFDAHLFYDEHAAKAQEISRGNYRLASYSVGFPSKHPNVNGEVKLQVRVHASGLVTIESATTTELYEVEEVVKAPAAAPAPATPASPSAEDDAAPATPETPEPPKETKVKKTKKRTVDLVLGAKASVLGLPSDVVAAAIKQEQAMEANDEKIRKTKEEKNALEGYIFENRSRVVEPTGMLHDFMTADQRAQFAKLADEYERWLEEDGCDATLDEYAKRVTQLRALGEPAFKRHKAHDDMPFHVVQFEKDMAKHHEKIAATKGKHSHISDEELAGADAAVVAASKWAREQLDALRTADKTVDPTFTKAQLQGKHTEVHTAVHNVLHKKAPPPPKEEKKKAEEAKAEDGASPPPMPEAEKGPAAPELD